MTFFFILQVKIFCMNYLDGLNDTQRQAVETTDGPVMVIAGPGSGKTRVLTYRIAHLIKTGVDPFRILALTFTNKASREMKERIEQIVGNEARNLWMGTFHSVFSRVLRVEAELIGFPRNYVIYDSNDSKSLIKTIIKELQLNPDQYKPSILQNRISLAKNNLIGPDTYLGNVNLQAEDDSAGRPKTGEVYRIYTERCLRAGAMDFDDLLVKMYHLLTKHPDLCKKYQLKFHHILVDEYQDTNFLQYQIIKILASQHQNICVVGDDAQSIYAFRGASISNILNFQNDYPNAKSFKLEQNYRSTKNIVQVANQIIGKNTKQIKKTIWTDNPEGSRVKLIRASSDNDEGRLIADSIFEERLRNHFDNKDFAILYRTNAQSRSFEEALRKKNIPYKVHGGLSFYDRKEVKDLMAYLKLVINHQDEESLRRVINYPTRGIGAKTIQKVATFAKETNNSMWEVVSNIQLYPLSSRAAKAVGDFATMIKSFAYFLSTHNSYEAAHQIAKQSGLLTTLYNDKTVEGLSRYENTQELLNSIKEFSEQPIYETAEGLPNDNSLGSYLQQISLMTSLDEGEDNDNAVMLMTIHGAKGLEFPNVYVVGMEEELFPSKRSMDSREGLEEERRLFYVATTRAEKKLNLSFAVCRYRYGELQYGRPSRFLDEIDHQYLDIKGMTSKYQAKPVQRSYAFDKKPQRARSSTPPPSKWKKINTKPSKKATNVPPLSTSNFKAANQSQLKVGTKVRHIRFGEGEIVQIEGGASKVATIHFHQFGEKRIMLKFAKLEVIG